MRLANLFFAVGGSFSNIQDVENLGKIFSGILYKWPWKFEKQPCEEAIWPTFTVTRTVQHRHETDQWYILTICILVFGGTPCLPSVRSHIELFTTLIWDECVREGVCGTQDLIQTTFLFQQGSQCRRCFLQEGFEFSIRRALGILSLAMVLALRLGGSGHNTNGWPSTSENTKRLQWQNAEL